MFTEMPIYTAPAVEFTSNKTKPYSLADEFEKLIELAVSCGHTRNTDLFDKLFAILYLEIDFDEECEDCEN